MLRRNDEHGRFSVFKGKGKEMVEESNRGYDTFDIDGQDVTMTIDEDRDNGTRYEETRRDTISDTTRYEAMR